MLAGKYEFLVNMDADFSHPPATIPILVSLMDRCDVAIGSRYVAGGEIVGWPAVRHVMSRGVNLLSRTLLGLSPRDTSGSFRCYRISLLRRIDFDRIIAKGYAFEEEILFRCRQVSAVLRIADPLRRPPGRSVENQRRRSRDGAAGYHAARLPESARRIHRRASRRTASLSLVAQGVAGFKSVSVRSRFHFRWNVRASSHGTTKDMFSSPRIAASSRRRFAEQLTRSRCGVES